MATPQISIVHELKTLPGYFQDIVDGSKPFEIRKDDRGFELNDILVLREWHGSVYSGRTVTAKVTCLCTYEQKPGYVVMGIKILDIQNR